MPDPDHLIERAAARLRTANGLVVPGRADAPRRPAPPPASPAEGEPEGTNGPLGGERLAGEHDSVVPADPAPGAIPLPAPPGSAPPVRDSRLVTAELGSPAIGMPDAGGAHAPALPTAAPISLADLMRIGLVVNTDARSRVSEEYRIIADRLRRVATSTDRSVRNLVMVTSARPGEGKSFTALNLATSLARSRTGRALLIDADVGPRSMTLRLGLQDRPGLHDLVAEPGLRPDTVVIDTEVPGLQFMPMGRPNQARAGVLPLGPALERISRRYVDTTVVLDTAPALSTSDPHAIAPHVAQVVLVVEAERTQRGEVEAALDLVRACPVISAVLNKTRFSAGYTFGAYDGYYYTASP